MRPCIILAVAFLLMAFLSSHHVLGQAEPEAPVLAPANPSPPPVAGSAPPSAPAIETLPQASEGERQQISFLTATVSIIAFLVFVIIFVKCWRECDRIERTESSAHKPAPGPAKG